MKQFRCPNLGPRAYTWNEIRDKFPSSLAAIRDLDVGDSATDVDRDRWFRLPDLVLQDGASGKVEHAAIGQQNLQRADQAERLERIATSVLVGLLARPATPEKTTWSELCAHAAFAARTLIAELDKQPDDTNPFEDKQS